jgi:hypothetical protein
MYTRTASAAIFVGLAVAGCAQTVPPSHASDRPTSQSISDAFSNGLNPPTSDPSLKAVVDPPINWKPDPPKISPNHRHQVWLSPTGDTAYGVIYFSMPLPMGVDTALWGFMREMKKTEGEANLLSKLTDGKLPGLRFVAEGGLYCIRCNLMVDGFHGWVVYAGSLRARPVNVKELKSAELAREQTRVNLQ